MSFSIGASNRQLCISGKRHIRDALRIMARIKDISQEDVRISTTISILIILRPGVWMMWAMHGSSSKQSILSPHSTYSPYRFHSYLQGKRSGQKFLSTTASDHFPAHSEDTSIRANTIAEGNGLLRALSTLYTPFKYNRLAALRENHMV